MGMERLSKLLDDRIQFGRVARRKRLDNEILYAVLQSSLWHKPIPGTRSEYIRIAAVSGIQFKLYATRSFPGDSWWSCAVPGNRAQVRSCAFIQGFQSG